MNWNAFLAGMFGSLTILDAVLLCNSGDGVLFLVGLLVITGGGLLTIHFMEEAERNPRAGL